MNGLADLDLRLLRVFRVVANSGGFTAAEAVLNVSQSTISNHMSALEERLGYRLCRRGRVGFKLTEKGVAVLAAADRLFAAIDAYRVEVHGLKGDLSGELRLGVADNTAADPNCPLIEAFRLFNRRDHSVTFNIKMMNPKEMQVAVLDGRLHMAMGFCPKLITGLNFEPLYHEQHHLYCGAVHPLFDQERPQIELEQLRSFRIISKDYWDLRDITNLGFNRADARVNEIEAELMLILSGSYLGFLPEHVAAPWLHKGMLRQLIPDTLHHSATLHLITPKGVAITPIADAFMSDLLDANQQINGERRVIKRLNDTKERCATAGS
jgi:DNA-binding transcriptional LysR family regulator